MKNNILEKISFFTKKKYKSLRSSVFLSVYGKIIISKKPPKTKIRLLKNINYKDFSKYKYKFCEVSGGRVFTDNIENVSIISKNVLLDKFSYQQIKGKLVHSKRNQVVRTGTPKLIQTINKDLAILAQGASGYNNYAHFLFDIIPKIKLFSLAVNIKKIDYFYYSKLNRYQKDIFKIIGINEKKIINSNKYRHLRCKKIYGVTHPNYFKGTFSYAQSIMPSWIVYYLKKKFLKYKNSTYKFRKVFIDRSDSKLKHCKLINNNEIKSFLNSKGFKILKLSDLDFKDQINIFNNAEIIIGPHGAGFANLVFCKNNTKVIELRPKNHPNKVFERISSINKLNHKLIKLKHIKNNKKGDMFLKKEILTNFI